MKRRRLRVGIQRWKVSTLVFLFGLVILACSIIYVLWPDQVYAIYVPREEGAPLEAVSPAGEDRKEGGLAVVREEDYRLNREVLRVVAEPRQWNPGEEREVQLRNPSGGETLYEGRLRMDSLGNLYEPETGDFQGYSQYLAALGIFFIAGSVSAFLEFFGGNRRDYYDYRNVFRAGMSLFLLCVGIIFLVQWGRLLGNPAGVHHREVLSIIKESGRSFMRFTQPFLAVFAVSLAVSNIALVRREGHRPQNFLGMALGGALLGGVALGFLLKVPGDASFWQKAFVSIYTAGFSYFECLLIGTILSALLAARHVPPLDQDYLVILGCGFAPDGSLYPLLRGRVDKALDFWHTQRRKAGKRAFFVPSGGQGAHEPTSEARAMAAYLKTQGVPEEDILLEDQSANTYENMLFSKKLIESREGKAGEGSRAKDPAAKGYKAIFVTTNYHLFRAGILARKVGFAADGLGSRTKWYFWPNAFVREFVGLLVAQRVRILPVLAFFVLILCMISFYLG